MISSYLKVLGLVELLTFIVAMSEDRVIGMNNSIPWSCPEDLQHFREYTLGKTVVMGRKTFESISKPLPDRSNIVVSRDSSWAYPGVLRMSVEEVLELSSSSSQEIVVIGGAEIYSAFLPYVDKMVISYIKGSYSGDAWFPKFEDSLFSLVSIEDKSSFVVKIFERIKL